MAIRYGATRIESNSSTPERRPIYNSREIGQRLMVVRAILGSSESCASSSAKGNLVAVGKRARLISKTPEARLRQPEPRREAARAQTLGLTQIGVEAALGDLQRLGQFPQWSPGRRPAVLCVTRWKVALEAALRCEWTWSNALVRP
jgi:hypothetical protein